jgi:type IV fimbrial biogenesis protein FimT
MDLVQEDNMERTTTGGFTLLELLTTITIIAVLASIAIPTFRSVRDSNAMATSVNLFLTQLHLARSSAVTRERRITLCPASDPQTCNNDHTAWREGYLIFQDSNKNRQRDSDEQLISYQERSDSQIKIVSSSRARNRISYLPMGRAWFSNTTVRFCHRQRPELNRAIIVSNNGRVRQSKRMADGSPISCP